MKKYIVGVALIWAACVIAVVYVAAHFIQKFW